MENSENSNVGTLVGEVICMNKKHQSDLKIMSELVQQLNTTNFNNKSNTSLHKLLKKCADFSSSESLGTTETGTLTDYNDVCLWNTCLPRMSINSHAPSENVSASSSVASDDSFTNNICQEYGRISLAYENLERIPRRIAEQFAAHTRILDLSYNNFQNLSFLAYFEDLNTLILDHNINLDPYTLPYMNNLKILWINNCNIMNIVDWIRRLQMQCPRLQQLSLMGNAGTKREFNYCTIPSLSSIPISIVTDCRNYVLDMLPNLIYLDGISRYTLTYDSSVDTSSTANCCHNNTTSNASNNSSRQSLAQQSLKPSLTLKFKDFFRFTLNKRTTYK